MSTAQQPGPAALPLLCAAVGVAAAIAMIVFPNQAHGAMPIFIAPFAVLASLLAVILGGKRRVYTALLAGTIGLAVVAVAIYRAVF